MLPLAAAETAGASPSQLLFPATAQALGAVPLAAGGRSASQKRFPAGFTLPQAVQISIVAACCAALCVFWMGTISGSASTGTMPRTDAISSPSSSTCCSCCSDSGGGDACGALTGGACLGGGVDAGGACCAAAENASSGCAFAPARVPGNGAWYASVVDCGARGGTGCSAGEAGVARFFAARAGAGAPHSAQNLSVSRICSPQLVQNIVSSITPLS